MHVWELKECQEIRAMLCAGGVCVCVRSGRHSDCSRLGAQWMGVRDLEGGNPTQDGQGPCPWPLHSHLTVAITPSPSSVPGMKRGHREKRIGLCISFT